MSKATGNDVTQMYTYDERFRIIMDFSNCDLECEINHSVEEFFYNLYKDYKSCNISYENDLKYSSYACNIVVNHILDCILINTANSYIFANCI